MKLNKLPQPYVTVLLICILIASATIMGWFGVAGSIALALVFGIVEGIKVVPKVKPIKRYGQE